MAFTKDSVNGIITFSYTRTLLFNNASLRSTYKARCLTDESGRYLGEPYALSDDERDAFAVCVENVVSDIYDTVLKMTTDVGEAFAADSDDVVFKIQDYQAYNENVLKNVDISIKNALINGILKEWYDLCAKPDFFKEYSEKYETCINLLNDRLFQLKKKTLM